MCVAGSRRLLRVGGRIWVVHEVARGSKACRVRLLLLLLLLRVLSWLTTTASSLCLSGEYWVREGGRSSWVGPVRECGSVIIQVQVEAVAIVVVIHLVYGYRSLDRLREKVWWTVVPQLLFSELAESDRSAALVRTPPRQSLGCEIAGSLRSRTVARRMSEPLVLCDLELIDKKGEMKTVVRGSALLASRWN